MENLGLKNILKSHNAHYFSTYPCVQIHITPEMFRNLYISGFTWLICFLFWMFNCSITYYHIVLCCVLSAYPSFFFFRSLVAILVSHLSSAVSHPAHSKQEGYDNKNCSLNCIFFVIIRSLTHVNYHFTTHISTCLGIRLIYDVVYSCIHKLKCELLIFMLVMV